MRHSRCPHLKVTVDGLSAGDASPARWLAQGARPRGQVTVALVSDATMCRLNREYRGSMPRPMSRRFRRRQGRRHSERARSGRALGALRLPPASPAGRHASAGTRPERSCGCGPCGLLHLWGTITLPIAPDGTQRRTPAASRGLTAPDFAGCSAAPVATDPMIPPWCSSCPWRCSVCCCRDRLRPAHAPDAAWLEAERERGRHPQSYLEDPPALHPGANHARLAATPAMVLLSEVRHGFAGALLLASGLGIYIGVSPPCLRCSHPSQARARASCRHSPR
jgi:hypothetical protein